MSATYNRKLIDRPIFTASLIIVLTLFTFVTTLSAAQPAVQGSLPGPAATAATCTVNSTADSGAGTLRQCLLDVASGDTITFDLTVFPPDSSATIDVTSGQLPDLDDGNVTIDASNAGVILDGSALSGGEDGLSITSGGNRVMGLQILRFPGDGTQISGTWNIIGGDRGTGTGPLGQGNLVSGNGAQGVNLWGLHNTIRGNIIGTNLAGTEALGNTYEGISVESSAQWNVYEGNLISGNHQNGIATWGTGDRIVGNIIGLDASGTSALGNQRGGISIENGANQIVIGGSTAEERNVISGNGGNGVGIYNTGTMSNTVKGNYIGADASGLHGLPNDGDGVTIADNARDNLIGGPTAADRNLIFANRNSGVNFQNAGTQNNTVQGNYIGLGLEAIRQAFPADQAVSPAYATDCTLFVATLSTGVHKSTDCSATWSEVNTGLTQLRLMQVEIPPDATNAQTAYALAENGYLFATTDGGASWGLVSTVLEGIDRRNLVLSAQFSSDHTMYASAQNWASNELGGQPGVFKSTDEGVTWTRSSNGMSNTNVQKVIASPDPAAKDTLFALTNGGIEKSTDGGANWAGGTAPDSNLRDLALSPAYATDQTVFVAAQSGPGRIYRSTDGGANWTGADALRGDPRFLAVSPDFVSDHTVCHGGGWNDGVYCSTDAGATWTAANTGLVGGLNDSGTGVAFAPNYGASRTLFVISNGGMARSADAGATWQILAGLREPGNNNGVAIGGGASDNAVLGNVISNNATGVSIDNQDTAYNVVAGNLVGTDPTGAFAQANTQDGIQVSGHHNTVGGPAGRNVVSGNLGDGVRVPGEQAAYNTIAGNYIGTNLAGTGAIGNRGAGVSIHSGATYNVIGGDEVGERNLISGNGNAIGISDSNTMRNTVSGNYIGTDIHGTDLIGNGGGVYIGNGASYNLVGGDTPGEANVIGGGGDNDVSIWGSGTNHNVVKGNLIGTDPSGTFSLRASPPQGWRTGVQIHSSAQQNQIGPGNVINGNTWGVLIYSASNNVILGNRIGTNINGTAPIGNFDHGVFLQLAQGNRVGGPTTEERNIISGNTNNGIVISNGSTANTVSGNYIGTDATGTAALGNGGQGVAFSGGANHNTIGGASPGEGNLISGNGDNGIALWNGGTSFNTILGNLIGTDASGAGRLPNGLATAAGQTASLPSLSAGNAGVPAMSGQATPRPVGDSTPPAAADRNPSLSVDARIQAVQSNRGDGVYIGDGASDNVVGAGNTIAFNGGNGVQVQGGAALRNTMTRNGIFANDRAGIALRDGGNATLAAPRVIDHDLAAGTASGTACASCTVEIFSAADEEGRTYEGTVSTNGSGAWSFAKGSALSGPYITATATDGDGNTSPFSPLFNLLVYDMGVSNTIQTLNNLGIPYDLVDGTEFATVDLSKYNVLFVGFTGNDPQPGDLLKPLLDRKANIEAFVRAGGGLVANSEDGVIRTTYDWQWVPVPVTHRNRGGNWIEFPAPTHLLLQGLTQQNLSEWPLYHNTFATWTWPGGEVLMQDPGSGDDVVLAGNLGSGRMVFSGADPDFHPSNWNQSTERMLYNELYWAAGMLQDTPPRVAWTNPSADGQIVPQALIRVSFDQMMNGGTVDAAAFQVSGSLSGPHTGVVTYLAASAQAVFVPDIPFTVGERVTVTVDGTAEDLTGNGLDGNRNGTSEGSPADDHIWSFDIRAGGTCLVSITADTGAGSLRKCLEDAQPGDTIHFDTTVFPPGSSATIALGDVNGQLPGLNRSYVTVDASDAGVILDGSAFSRDRGDQGITIYSDGNAVYGLRITGFPGDGITVSGWRNIIGGSGAGQGNVIGSNGQNGIRLNGANAQGNTVSGNIIGGDATGHIAAPNSQSGITVENGAQGNLIGGPAAGDRNLIFSNGQEGVNIQSANGNTVQGNQIGLGLDAVRQAFPSDQAVSPGYATDDTLYVATRSSGVFKSTDGGASWAEANTGLTELRLSQVEIPPDAANADTAYALSDGGTLFRTTDGGAHWALVSTELSQIDRRNLVLSATFSSDVTMYAAAQNWASLGTSNQPGVFKSTDGGVTWARSSNGMSNTNVWKVIASPDPAAKDTLFALTNGGIEKSTDGGANWAGGTAPDSNLRDLALSPAYATDQTVFVAAQSGPGRIYRSTDGGATWTGADALRGDPRFLAVSPSFTADHRVCHGGGWNDGVYCSIDAGATWTAANTGLVGGLNDGGTGIAFAPDYGASRTLFVISNGGMARSADNGATWQILAGLREPGNNTGVAIGNGANHNTVRDNVISNNGTGVSIDNQNASDNVIAGNLIGTDPTGAFAQANMGDGVAVSSPGNTIGGATGRNVISGNMWYGVRVAGDQAAGNIVAGNLVGTNSDGTGSVGNLSAGVFIQDGAHDNLIGGNTAAARNIISGNGSAIGMWGSNTVSNTISGNYIGVDATGTAALGNGEGIQVSNGASYNVIGGATAGERNVISGNSGQGVNLSDSNTAHNRVIGNYIGTDATGLVALGNGSLGVGLWYGASYNIIGGPTAGERNVVSGNDNQGIGLVFTGTSDNLVEGNYVGIDASGNVALGNRFDGIAINGGDHNQVRNNVVSSNGWAGVELCCSGDTNYNTISSNRIGTNATGTASLPNQRDGIIIHNGAHHNTIGGAGPGDGNLISGNAGAGVDVQDSGTTHNTLLNNLIGTDASGAQPLPNGLAAAHAGAPDLSGPATPQQVGDSGNTAAAKRNPASLTGARLQAVLSNAADGVYIGNGASDNVVGAGNTIAFNGGNGVQVQGGATLRNTITRNGIYANDRAGIALRDGGNATLAAPRVIDHDLAAGTASGTACASCTVEIFSADDEEGRTYEGTVTAGGSGAWSFAVGSALAGPYVTATATDSSGNTSPFSPLFNLLVFDMGVPNTTQTLDNLGLPYDLVDGIGFAAVDLSQYDVLFVGFTGNDPKPGELLKPLYDRKAEIEAFVRAGGGLVANSEDGVIRTTYDWQWVPVPVTHQNRGGNWIEFPAPTHLLLQGLTQQNLSEWPLYHNTFSAWTWADGEVLMRDPGSGDAVVLAGALDGGRMIFSGADPDYHTSNWSQSTEQMLHNELYWAAGMLEDTPLRIAWTNPDADGMAVPQSLIRVGFDQMVDAGTVNAAAFRIIGAMSGLHSGVVTYLAESAQAVFVPDAPFTLGERVTVTVRGTVQDLTGNGLDGDRDGVAEGSPADDAVWGFDVRAGSTCLVSSAADAGPDTLRQCLQDAQTGDTIRFGTTVFPAGSPVTITITSGQLPDLSRGYITVDASDAGVIVDGSAFSGGEDGLGVSSDGNAVYGAQFSHFPGDGIEVAGWRNTIGGPGVGQGNIFSNNGQNGVRISNRARQNIVAGNIVGADAAGLNAAPNRETGIKLEGGTGENRIGGPNPADRNLVFANGQDGVYVDNSHGNTVQGNWIGLGLEAIQQAFPTDQAVSPAYTSDCTLYVSTRSSGMHRSTDCGATWTEVNTGLTDLRLNQVEIPPDATDADTAFALSESGSLFRTTDGGAHWSSVSQELTKIDRRNLVLSATFTADDTMYAAAQWWAWQEYGNQPGVFKSIDGGNTWAHADTGIPDNHVYKVVASPDPAAAGVLFALTNSGIAATTDGGASWTAVSNPGSGGYLADLAMSPDYATDSTLFVAEHAGTGRVHRSTDGGATWTSADTQRGDPRFLALSPDFAGDHTVCHGGGWNDSAYCSTNAGDTWEQYYVGLAGGVSEYATGLAFVPNFATSHTMFEISYGGIAKSTDSGANWQVLSSLRQPGNRNGVMISNAATDNQILDNVISNNVFGVSIQGTGTAHNTVGGNIIGLDPTGASAQGNADDGIQVNGDHNTIGGAAGRNLISGNLMDGIRVSGSSAGHNAVVGNYIGTDAAGRAAIGNRGAGISIHSGAHNTLVGGNAPAERNVISSNGYGIGLWDSDTTLNTVIGNFIGLDMAGTADLGNDGDGVRVNNGAHHNVIGSAAPGERNVISGNGSNGIGLWDTNTSYNTIGGNLIGTDATGAAAIGNGATGIHVNGPNNTTIRYNVVAASGGSGIDLCCNNDTSYNRVYGNYVGTNATGDAALPNGGDGINMDQGHHNAVGGDTADERNVISGNNGQGISIQNSAHDNVISGNHVGTNAAGDAALPNGGDGIHIRSDASDNIVGPHNILAFNRNNGVTMWDGGTLRNTVTGNSIHSNDGFGIDLWDGANTELAAPMISEVTASSCRVTGTTCASCKVEVFSDAAYQGRWYEGTVTANPAGEWIFSKGSACTGAIVRTTATDADGNTSQFSVQPESPVVRMFVVSTGIELRWKQFEGGIDHYKVYRSTSPYFVPGTGTWLADVGAPGPGNEATYPDTTAFALPLTNYYYIVLAVNEDGLKSPVMSRGGGFHFSLTPGQ